MELYPHSTQFLDSHFSSNVPNPPQRHQSTGDSIMHSTPHFYTWIFIAISPNHHFQHVAQPIFHIVSHRLSIFHHLFLTLLSLHYIKNHFPQTKHIASFRTRGFHALLFRSHKLSFVASIIQQPLQKTRSDVRQSRHQRGCEQHIRRTEASVNDRRVVMMKKTHRSRDLKQQSDLCGE